MILNNFQKKLPLRKYLSRLINGLFEEKNGVFYHDINLDIRHFVTFVPFHGMKMHTEFDPSNKADIRC